MSDAERSNVASVNESSFEEDVDKTQTSDVQEVKDSGRQRMLKIGGGIGLGVILLIAIIVPCVMLLPKTTEAVTTTETISTTNNPASTTTLTNPTIASTEALIDTTTEKPPFILGNETDYLCNSIPESIEDGNLCFLIIDVELKACNSSNDECYGFYDEQCYGPPEGGSWEFCMNYCNEEKQCGPQTWYNCNLTDPTNGLPECDP